MKHSFCTLLSTNFKTDVYSEYFFCLFAFSPFIKHSWSVPCKRWNMIYDLKKLFNCICNSTTCCPICKWLNEKNSEDSQNTASSNLAARGIFLIFNYFQIGQACSPLTSWLVNPDFLACHRHETLYTRTYLFVVETKTHCKI